MMTQRMTILAAVLNICVLSFGGLAAENDYFPLIENSTYTYSGKFKDKEVASTVTLKSGTREGVVYYYFLDSKDERKPTAIIMTTGIGRGLYSNDDGNLAVMDCFQLNEIDSKPLKDRVIVLKKEPAVGDKAENKSPKGDVTIVWTVVGFEDVTVPAGNFKQCLKIKLEENWAERKRPAIRGADGAELRPATVLPPERYVGAAWLAKGVGTVKWQRGTGRVDELTDYKIPEPKK